MMSPYRSRRFLLAAAVVVAVSTDGVCSEAGPSGPLDREMAFELIWDTDSINSSKTAMGDVDGDGLFDFVGSHSGYPYTTINLFESDGSGSYGEVWSGNTSSGACVAFAYGDTDGDGLGEILAARAGTWNSIEMFEYSGYGSDFESVPIEVHEPEFGFATGIVEILVGDTDLDGRQEIIIIRTHNDPAYYSLVAIWEHTGDPGEHTYTRVYSYRSYVPRFLSGALGDVDHDGYPEIVLGCAIGAHVSVRRVEYSPVQATWQFFNYDIPFVGESFQPTVADVDGDGDVELLYGQWGGGVYVVESTGENQFEVVNATHGRLDNGTNMSTAAMPFQTSNHRRPLVAAGTFEGAVGVYTPAQDGPGFALVDRLDLGGPVDDLGLVDDGHDGRCELIAVVRYPEKIAVYRQQAARTSAVLDPPLVASIGAYPNPFNPQTTIQFVQLHEGPVVVSVHDLRGRLANLLVDAVLSAGTHTFEWDGRDACGRALPAGTYVIRLDSSTERRTARVSLVR